MTKKYTELQLSEKLQGGKYTITYVQIEFSEMYDTNIIGWLQQIFIFIYYFFNTLQHASLCCLSLLPGTSKHALLQGKNYK